VETISHSQTHLQSTYLDDFILRNFSLLSFGEEAEEDEEEVTSVSKVQSIKIVTANRNLELVL
jgi:hypothetical protein